MYTYIFIYIKLYLLYTILLYTYIYLRYTLIYTYIFYTDISMYVLYIYVMHKYNFDNEVCIRKTTFLSESRINRYTLSRLSVYYFLFVF